MLCRAKHEKCQGVVIDLLFAVLIFLLLLNASFALWQNNAILLQNEVISNQLRLETTQVADMLVRHEGEPDDWEKKAELGAVAAIGLAKRDRVLDETKVQRFAQLAATFWSSDYNAARVRLLAGRDFYFKLSNSAGGVIAETAHPDSPVNQWAVNVKRVVKFGGDAAVAELTLYLPK